MKSTRIATYCKWIFFLVTLITFALTNIKQAAAQTAIANPAGTTVITACTADTRAIGFPNGNTFSYANTGWPSCTAWGFSSTAGIPVCRANVPVANACAWDNVTYNAAAPTNLAGGVMCFTGTTNYRASNGTTYADRSTSIRMVVTVTDNSNNPMQLQVSGGYVYVVIPDPSFTFKAKVELQAYGPASVVYATTGNGTTVPIGCTGTPNNTYTCGNYLNTWVGAIQLYNCISTDATYKICTQFIGSTFLSAGVPVAPATPTGATTICVGGSATLSRVGAPLSGVTWYWQTATNGTDVTNSGATYSPSPGATTTYYLRPRVGTCWGTASAGVTVTVVADPTVVISGTASACFGTSVTLTATPAGGTGTTVTYLWERSPTGLNTWTNVQNTATATYPTGTGLVAGVYDFRVTYTQTISGCVSAASTIFVFTVNALPAAPTPVSATPTPICLGAAVTFNGTSAGNTINWFTVATGGTAIATAASGVNVNYTPPAAGTFTYYAQSNGTCPSATRTAATAVVVNPIPAIPTAVSATAATICAGGSSNLVATSTGNTIRWYTVATGGSNIGTSASAVNFAVSPASTTTYYAESYTPAGCPSATRVAVTVTVVADPTVTISGNVDACVGSSITMTAVPAGGQGSATAYLWERSPAGAGTWTTVQNTASATYATSTALTAGNYDYRVTLTQSVSGCVSSASAIVQAAVTSPDIIIAQVPTVNVTPTSICAGGTVTLTASGLVPGGMGSNSSGVRSQTAVNQYVSVASNGSLQTGAGDFTYEMWVYPTAYTTYNTYFSNGAYTAGTLFRQANPTQMDLYINGVQVGGNLTYNPPLNTWTHLALVRSGSVIGLYVNGCRYANFTTTFSGTITPVTPLIIGGSQHALTTENWRGLIDEFRLWKGVALTPATMTAYRTIQVPNTHPNWASLSCAYRFNGDYTNSGSGAAATGVATGGGFAAPNCYTYTWTGSGAPAGSVNEVQTATPSSNGTYTVTAARSGYTTSPVSAATASVTVNPIPAAPTSVTATAASICVGQSSNLNATSAGNTIRWYTVASGGANIGTSASGANFSVSPVITTTYYAEAFTGAGCPSATRTAVTVTVLITPITPNAIEGTTTICVGATSTLSSPLAAGGNITKAGGYRIHAFYSNGTLNITNVANVEVLVVGGGGGGGFDMGGGGGAGGVIANSSFAVTPGSYTITVGAGGKGAPAGGTLGQPAAHQFTQPAANGGNSVFSTLTAIGGGRGGSSPNTFTPGSSGAAGGSGGGASGYNNQPVALGTVLGGAGTAGQGFRGGNQGNAYYSGGGGGAGGAGADGNNQPNGGVGVSNSILGTAYFWGGGGGGSAYSAATGGNGGNGGGGGGAVGVTTGGAGFNNGCGGGGGAPNVQTNTHGANAGANTGGGGGAGSHYNAYNSGGGGGSGIVVVRYLDVSSNGTWSSSAPGIATVDPTTGVVTAVAPGTTTISFTATNGSCGSVTPATTVVTVVTNPAAPTSSNINICPGGTGNISATSAGNLIKWYDAPTGGTLVGVTASGVNLAVTPGSTTTYYAEAVANNPYATGGTVSTFGSYRIHRFNATTTPFTFLTGGTTEVLVVAGGGGGGSDMGGGGGAGGVIINNSFPVAAGAYTVTVGTGGAGAPAGIGQVSGSNGTNSIFSTLTAIGGGGGGSEYANNTQPGRNGGSGGGCAGYLNTTFGIGTAGQGYNGGASGGQYVPSGGGGAGGPGLTNPSHGGPGIASSILGTTYYFAGGGGGAGYSMIGGNGGKGGGGGGGGGITLGGTGGLNNGAAGGGGALVQQCNRTGGNAGANTGGGGGGGSHYNLTNAGGTGGSGIVVVRYIDAGCSSSTRTPVTVTVIPSPTLTSASQQATVCSGSPAQINLTGLIASSTSTVSYSINGVAQTPVAGVASNGSGQASFNTVVLTPAMNGQTLQITGITRTDLSPNCSSAFAVNVTLAVNTTSQAPTSASAATNPACPGATVSISASGGTIGTGASVNWYSGSCGGTFVGTGNPYNLTVPSSATTYYVRYEGGSCATSSCTSFVLNTNTLSTAPTSVSPVALCQYTTTTLNQVGGSLGTGAVYRWYSTSCGVGLVGTGPSITVTPSTPTVYYVRAEGTCNNTACANSTSNDVSAPSPTAPTVPALTGETYTGTAHRALTLVSPYTDVFIARGGVNMAIARSGGWPICANWGLPSTINDVIRGASGPCDADLAIDLADAANTDLALGKLSFTGPATFNIITTTSGGLPVNTTVDTRIRFIITSNGVTPKPIQRFTTGHYMVRANADFRVFAIIEARATNAIYYSYSQTASVTSGSATMTLGANNQDIRIGMTVLTGPGAAGLRIIDRVGTTVTLSGTSSSTNAGAAFTFGFTNNTWGGALDLYDNMYKSTTGSLLSTCFSFDKYLSIAGIGTITATASPNPYCLTAPAQTITLTGTTGNLTTSCGLTHEWYTAASITGAPAYTSNPQTGLTPVSGQVYYYAVTNTTSDVCYGTAQTLPLVQNVPVADEPNFPAATFSTNLTTTWTGASTNGSDDWFIHDNWSHCVPNATTNALINYNAANQPEVTTQTGNANAMKIMTGSPGAKVTITPPAAKIVLTY